MQYNKIAVSLLLGLGLVTSGANAADGKVTFTGSIIDSACSIAPDSQDQEVAMGAIAATQLEKGGKSTARDFHITLENCALASAGAGNGNGNGGNTSRAAAAKSVSVTFDGLKDGEMLALNPDSDAKGAGIVITDDIYSPIALGKPSSVFELAKGKNVLDFKAYLQGSGATTAIETGQFEAVAKFTLNYE